MVKHFKKREKKEKENSRHNISNTVDDYKLIDNAVDDYKLVCPAGTLTYI